MDPMAVGSWNDGCNHQRSGYLDTCGPAFGEAHPAPAVTISSPLDQEIFEAIDGNATIDIAYDVQHEWPIREVRFVINGDVGGYDPVQGAGFYQWPPAPTFEGLSGNFPEGTYDIRIEAEDWGGVVGFAQVNVAVGNETPNPTPEPEPGDSGDGSGGDSGDDSGDSGVGETGGDAGLNDRGDEGCACDVGREQSPLGALGLLLPLGVLGLRRRRR
jgi:MYXO-CTERM domain-containing protein